MIVGKKIYLLNNVLIKDPYTVLFSVLIIIDDTPRVIALKNPWYHPLTILQNIALKIENLVTIKPDDRTEITLHDLPLYIDWPWKTPEFLDLIKRGRDD